MRKSLSPAAHEQRRHPRHAVTDMIEVFDVFAECPLGTLVNISSGGMMLSSAQPIPLNRIFQVTLPAPEPALDGAPITLGAESLWQRASADGRQYWTGFQLISVADQDRNRLECMLGEL
jgi:hypothetical protein